MCDSEVGFECTACVNGWWGRSDPPNFSCGFFNSLGLYAEGGAQHTTSECWERGCQQHSSMRLRTRISSESGDRRIGVRERIKEGKNRHCLTVKNGEPKYGWSISCPVGEILQCWCSPEILMHRPAPQLQLDIDHFQI
jgi:hypothetical protein